MDTGLFPMDFILVTILLASILSILVREIIGRINRRRRNVEEAYEGLSNGKPS